MSLATLCNTTLSLLRPTVTTDPVGGQIRTFATIAAAIPACVFQSPRGTDKDWDQRAAAQISHQVLLYQDIAARVGDVILVADGRKMQVILQGDQGGRGRVWSLDCREIVPE